MKSSGSEIYHLANYTSNPLGRAVIPTATLVAAETTIYGYSIFSNAVTAGNNLVNWTSLEPADSTSTGGGLDPPATVGVSYSRATLPKPTTAAIVAMTVIGLLGRRRTA